MLKVLNSLTGKAEPLNPNLVSTPLSWYVCGPTVYDSAHLGHARAYVTFDIMRRILEVHFGLHIQYIMNITDIDDKIIVRSRRNYLLRQHYQQLGENNKTQNQISQKQMIHRAYQFKIDQLQKKLKQVEQDKNTLQEVQTQLDNAMQSLKEINETETGEEEAKSESESMHDDILAEWIDFNFHFGTDQHEVSIKNLCAALSKQCETEFWHDMFRLNVQQPTVLTRVSEYMNEIIEFVHTLVQNGLAYATMDTKPLDSGSTTCNHSVYFNVGEFIKRGHTYDKLCPNESFCEEQKMVLLREAEGESNHHPHQTNQIEANAALYPGEKRNPMDFALWKAQKTLKEPFWSSPWGNGRPGWHTECSCFIHHLCRGHLDIHSGGIDLKFPHHSNELAQLEAIQAVEYSSIKSDQKEQAINAPSYVDHFWHAGKLMIDNLKMSKSMKNFITIDEALQSYTSNEIRMWILGSPWHETMNYRKESMTEARQRCKLFQEFFLNIQAVIRQKSNPIRNSVVDDQYFQTLNTLKKQVHESLCDNLSYHTVLQLLCAFVKDTNKYMAVQSNSSQPVQALLLQESNRYVNGLLQMFGLDFSSVSTSSKDGSNHSILDAVCLFRDRVRESSIAVMKAAKQEAASSKPNKALAQQLLSLCDEFRDGVMPQLGVRIEDGPNGKSVWKAKLND